MMTPKHKDWKEFRDRLEGPEGCDFRKDDAGEIRWNCAGGEVPERHVKAGAILESMGFDEAEVRASLRYFEEHGGYCDCEVLFNVEASAAHERAA